MSDITNCYIKPNTVPLEYAVHLSDHKFATWSLHGPHGMLVRINLDTGEHTFGDGYNLDDAARIFWENVARWPSRPR